MHAFDASDLLLKGLRAGLDRWASREGNTAETLYWVLRTQLAETGLDAGSTPGDGMTRLPDAPRDAAPRASRAATANFDDIRYAALAPVAQVWGTVVNAMRVASDSNRATAVQKQVFAFTPASVAKLFRALRGDIELADQMHRTFRAMPTPECQAVAALLNVDLNRSPHRSGVENELDAETMVRLVRLLDHEGPMSDEEQQYLASLTPQTLVDAAFSGLRSRG
jgi:hypothetical protein